MDGNLEAAIHSFYIGGGVYFLSLCSSSHPSANACIEG